MFEMGGSWYSLDMGNKGGPEKLANGLANLKTILRGNEVILNFLRKKIEALSGEDNMVKV
jgi:hypothetical protein